MVRIVDYREEIVRLYNEVVHGLRAREVALSPKMTPREVESRLEGAIPGLSHEAVRDLVDVFEEANYSMHPVVRLAYERMYLACEEVRRYALSNKPEARSTKSETNSNSQNTNDGNR
jgi:hypothetical protein